MGRTRTRKHLRSPGMAFWLVPELGRHSDETLFDETPLVPGVQASFVETGFVKANRHPQYAQATRISWTKRPMKCQQMASGRI